jgi:hypothetical protein
LRLDRRKSSRYAFDIGMKRYAASALVILWFAGCTTFRVSPTTDAASATDYRGRLFAAQQVAVAVILFAQDHSGNIPAQLQQVGRYVDRLDNDLSSDILSDYEIATLASRLDDVEQWQVLVREKAPDRDGLQAVALASGSSYLHYTAQTVEQESEPVSLVPREQVR